MEVNKRIAGRLLVGVFVPGAPLRSKTIVVRSCGVTATTDCLPLSRDSFVPGRLKAERHTTVKLNRIDSTVAVVISRRANNIDVTRGADLLHRVDQSSFITCLASRLIIRRRRRGAAGFVRSFFSGAG